MVLVNTIVDVAFENCVPPNVIQTSVALDDEQVAALQPQGCELGRSKLEALKLGQVQVPTLNIADSQVWSMKGHRIARWRLLNAPANIGDDFQCDTGPCLRFVAPKNFAQVCGGEGLGGFKLGLSCTSDTFDRGQLLLQNSRDPLLLGQWRKGDVPIE